MADTRELVLARLLTVCGNVTGISAAVRNRDSLSDIRLPAIQIFDGDEEVNDLGAEYRRSSLPAMVIMRPLLYVSYADLTADIGSTINAARARIIAAVMGDATLQTIVGANGKVRYEGSNSGLQPARKMTAQMMINFSFTYPLKIEDIA